MPRADCRASDRGRTAAGFAGTGLLTRPAFLCALVLLLANDLYLKAHATSWLTGKLSDFAGLFVFAVFWSAIAPRARRGIHIGTGVAFLVWKSPWSEPLIAMWNAAGPWQVYRIVDYTDWVALLVLPAAYRYSSPARAGVRRQVVSLWRTPVRAVVSVICLAAMVATSAPPAVYHVAGWREEASAHARSFGPLHVQLNDVRVYGHSDFSPTLIVRNGGRDTAVLRHAALVTGGYVSVARSRGGRNAAHLVVAPGAEDSVTLAWPFASPTFSGYSGVRPAGLWTPATLRLTLDVGDTVQAISAVLDTESRAHPARHRIRIARHGAAIFLTGLLVALIRRDTTAGTSSRREHF